MLPVGLIVNPVSGRDIRRLVAQAWVVTHQEKVALTARLLQGIAAAGAATVLFMPEPRGICLEAHGRLTDSTLELQAVDMPVTGLQEDSTRAARSMAQAGVGCIVTLGGDGTNRAVFKGCGTAVPLLPISTGTNNVFPEFQEGTAAGYAAGLAATGNLPGEDAIRQRKMLRIRLPDGSEDAALIDLAISRDLVIGARAIWDVSRVDGIVLTQAEPWNVGLSSIGGCLRRVSAEAPEGLYLTLGAGGEIARAPIAPGIYRDVPVASLRVLSLGEQVRIPVEVASTLALDGERDAVLSAGDTLVAELSAEGPRVLDTRRALTPRAGD